jgi:undecaprenyl-diphosphatase
MKRHMAEWLQVIIMGIVQGITEYLPISSTGHLIVAAALLDFQSRMGGTFEIFIQIGSVAAVLAFYRADLLNQARSARTDAGTRRLWLAIAIAFVPAAGVGFLLRDFIKSTLYSPAIVGISLIIGGIIFLVIERLGLADRARTAQLTAVRPAQAVIIGLAQMTALVPGISRSGASIVGGLFAGLDRQTATRFSFYLAIPTLGTATIFDLLSSLDQIQGTDWAYLVLGAAVSAIVSWLAIGWLLRFVARSDFSIFGYYRIAAGIVILLLVANGLNLPLN